MKYIMFEVNGVPAPVLFPDHVPHKIVAAILDDIQVTSIQGAGFFSIIGNSVLTSGYSESLGLSSKPEDAKIIAMVLGMRAAEMAGAK